MHLVGMRRELAIQRANVDAFGGGRLQCGKDDGGGLLDQLSAESETFP